jgi:cellulose synthase/poly-beta-1,6-N-acetylglucosamine synthase-like glycosyltransferase
VFNRFKVLTAIIILFFYFLAFGAVLVDADVSEVRILVIYFVPLIGFLLSALALLVLYKSYISPPFHLSPGGWI